MLTPSDLAWEWLRRSDAYDADFEASVAEHGTATSMTAHLRAEDGSEDAEIVGHIPLGRFGQAGDIGPTIILLSSLGGAYITGAHIPVDGGLSGCG